MTVTRGIVRVLLAFAPLAAGAYVNCYWLADADGGTGGWADTTRWRDGVKPGPNDVVRISGGNTRAVVTDDDWEFFSTLFEIVLANGATVVLDLTNDVVFNGGFQGSKGRVVKLNANRIILSGSRESNSMQLKGGEFVVSNGFLRIDAAVYKLSPSIIKVYKPGVLELSNQRHTYVGGLVGDGIVSNTAPVSSSLWQMIFMGELLEKQYPTSILTPPPWRFTGDFKGCVPITAGTDVSHESVSGYFGPGGQVFDTVTATNLTQSSPRFGSGFLSLASIGNQGGTGASSIGNYDAISFFNLDKNDGETGIIYVGSGGTSTRNFDLYYARDRAHGVGAISVFDAGPVGGLRLTGTLKNRMSQYNVTPEGTMCRFVLRGSNTTACAFAGTVTEDCSTNGLTFIKQGTGTWNFDTSGFSNNGSVFVEKGTLQFNSIEERGKACALGKAKYFSTNWYGVADAGWVPFAHLVGDGSALVDEHTATMEYTGSGVGGATTRPFAINGAGRIRNSGAGSLRLCGAYSVAEGVNSLVLGGVGDDNCFSDVTNGVGTLKVVKEGTGTWQLSGDVKLGGGVEVKAGTLRISNRFSWYRLNLMEAWGLSTGQFGFRLFGLWDEDGNLLSKDLTKYSLNSKVTCLPKGGTTCAVTNGLSITKDWENAYAYKKTDGVIPDEVNPVQTAYFRVKMTASTSGNLYPKASEPDTWLRYVIRPAEGTKPAACYDFKAEETSSHANHGMEMKAFGMDGSPDGVHWVEISATNRVTADWGSYGNWHSTRSSTRTKNDGFRLSATRDSEHVIADLPVVSVAEGAVLDVEPEAGVTVSGIAYDVANGGGTVKGVTFAANGTVAVVGNVDLGKTTSMPMAFESVSDLANVSSWTPWVNGVEKRKMRVKARASGLLLCPAGITVSFR